jgi:tripartite-type tricarboxylate transporter receptor subunit TctC
MRTIAAAARIGAKFKKNQDREEPIMKAIARLIAGAAALVFASACFAQTGGGTYPARSVKMVVPFAAAGPTDVIARLVAQKLSESLGQQFYVENIPGAGGNIGTAQVAKAAPDGHTMLVVSTGFIVNPHLYAKGVPYDIAKDFRPLTLVAASPNVLTVNPAVAAKDVKELIALIKANPGKYAAAQPATGSTPHLNGELFKLAFGLDLTIVPFAGAAPAITSTIGGHTPMAFTALPPAMANVKDGKLRALAVLSTARVPALPDTPTAAEAGIPGHEGDTLTGIVLPAGTPKGIVDKLNAEIKKLIALPDVKEKLEALGFAPIANTPAEFGARIDSEGVKWSKVIRDAKIQIQ